MRQAGFKVVLTGEGSDEIFGGYPHFRRDMLLYDNDGQEPAAVQALLAELERTNQVSRGLLLPDGKGISTESLSRRVGFTPSWLAAFATSTYKVQSLFAADYAAGISQRDPFKGLLDSLDIHGQITGRAPVHKSLYLWAKTVLPNYILTVLGDRMEMAHSVEGRVPFLDHHVVELICSMPVRQKIRGMTEKYVLREATRGVITDTVYNRQKHPFLSPPATLDQDGRLNQLMQDTLRGPILASLPFFDRRKVAGLLDTLPAMNDGDRTAVDQGLMLMLSACVLQDRFGLSG